MKQFLFVLVTFFCWWQSSLAQKTFNNPLKTYGPDPWVIQKNGWYYYTNTMHDHIALWRTRNPVDLSNAEQKVIFRPPVVGAYSKKLWAPELHFLRGKWYVYFAADSGHNNSHRIWVIENPSPDPMQGTWTLKGKLADPGDHWAIDMSVLEHKGQLFATWSGWSGRKNASQDIYIAKLKNPWTMDGDRVKLCSPTLAWEKSCDIPKEWIGADSVKAIKVNEGPQFLVHKDRLFIVFSVNAFWTDYCLGMLETRIDANWLNPKAWKKHPQPVFVESPEAGIYGPGHNCFFKSPDGREDWIMYHASGQAFDVKAGDRRAPYAQRFTWNADGTPNFGKPAPKLEIAVPSGF